MAAPDTSLSRIGQINQVGAVDALFLKQFGGEILTEFNRTNVFKDRHFVRHQQWPVRSVPAHRDGRQLMHTPGAWIHGASVPHAEVVLTIDGLGIDRCSLPTSTR